MSEDIIEMPLTKLTDETFERQGWRMIVGEEELGDGESVEFYYWELSLPKDNPDEHAPVLISTGNDEWQEYDLEKGQYLVEIANMFGLGLCSSEEELEILYRSLTKDEIEPDIE